MIFPADNEASGIRRGWLDRVSVRRPWRRQGVGRALIAASLNELQRRGMEIASLGVDADNPTGALELYEGLGFRQDKRSTAYRKPIRGF
jgi:ribosomal protein S18 acetylase RimI-like enzyme